MKPFKLVYKPERGTELAFLPVVDPLTQEPVPEVRDHAKSDVLVTCHVGKCAAPGKPHEDLLALVDDLGKLALTPFDEQRERLLAEAPHGREKILDCLRKITGVDYAYFGHGREVALGERAMERYAKPLCLALLAMRQVQELEERLYGRYCGKYEIHFDVVNREVIIAKLPPRGMVGWFRRHTRQSFGVEPWRKTIRLVGFAIIPQTARSEGGRPMMGEAEDAGARADRLFGLWWNAALALALLATLAGCWLHLRSRERAWRERILRDPQGAAARVERRLAETDPAYRLCRRASAAALGLPKEARP